MHILNADMFMYVLEAVVFIAVIFTHMLDAVDIFHDLFGPLA